MRGTQQSRDVVGVGAEGPPFIGTDKVIQYFFAFISLFVCLLTVCLSDNSNNTARIRITFLGIGTKNR